MESIFVGVGFLAVGVGFIYLYAFVAKRYYGANINIVQAVMYKVNTDGMPFGKWLLELVLRVLKYLGLFFAIFGMIAAFSK